MIRSFLAGQMDCVYLLYGTAFILIAAVAFLLRRQGGSRMPWRWLCLFGLAHGVSEWLEIVALSAGDPPWFAALRLAVMAVSFVFLIEFSRAHAAVPGLPVRHRAADAPSPGRWVYMPLLACACAGGMAGARGMDATIRYALGFTGAAWAAATLLRHGATIDPAMRTGLRLAAFAMAVYAVAAGLVVPAAGFPPASVLNSEWFTAVTGLPVQVVRAAAAAGIAVGIWRHYHAVRHAAVFHVGDVPHVHADRAIAVTLLVVLAAGCMVTRSVGRATETAARNLLLAVARTAASAVDPAQLAALSLTGADATNEQYHALRATLTRLENSTAEAGIRSFHAMSMRGGRIVLTADSVPAELPGHAAPGTPYTEAPAGVRTVFETGSPLTIGPYKDRRGAFISCCVPVVTTETGRASHVLAIDVDAGAWAARVAAHRLAPILITLLVSLMLLLFFLVRQSDAEAKELLAASESRYRNLTENISDWIWEIDTRGRYVYASPQVKTILGYEPDEVLGRTAFDFMPDDEAARLRPVFAALMTRPERVSAIENVNRHKDGHLITIETSAVPILLADGTFTGYRGIDRDITERTRAISALHESERMLATLMSNLPGMAYRCRNDRQWTMEFVSEGCLALTGYPPHALMFNSLVSYEELIKPSHRDFVRHDVEAALEHHAVFELSYPIRTAEGGEKWVWERGRGIYDSDGRLQFLEGFVTDVTDRTRAEEDRRKFEAQMQHTQKLESLGILAGGIAHDFNNLLMAILGNVDLALKDLSPVSPVRDNLVEVERTARRAADLCRQMLAYSGRGRFVVEPLSLNEVVSEMAHMLEVSVSKKAALRFSLAPDLPPINADATQVRQVVMNLVINASEAIGDQNGLIAVTTGAVQCDRAYLSELWLSDELPPGCYVMLEVADTGCGMSKETQARIFDPFFTTKFTGRGLCLAAVHGIVRGHKGAIKVYSEPGQGTTVKVLFPASGHAFAPQRQDAAQEPAWRGAGTVLVADDEDSVRTLGARMLEYLGFTALTAANGREAVDVFAAHKDDICCVILDLTMPEMDGEQTFRELRRIKSDVKVFLTSGYNEQDVTQRFADKGLAGFLQKPYDLDVLSAKLRAATGGPREDARH
ncbi:PAS domain S-box protein [bacterium]|nr:PAS domain S-box protein [bacterium]